jgi:DNA processing protein
MQLMGAERLSWLRLARSENVGPVTFMRLLERYGTAAAALDALPELARKGGRTQALRIATRSQAEKENEELGQLGGRLILRGDADYPASLARLDDAPPVLSALGHPQLLSKPCIGMVGARNASIVGRRMADMMARDLASAGCVVVSGLARGIDAAAHWGALAGAATGNGGTVAMVAGGVDVIYPRENAELYAALRERGCIFAESPLGMEPQARHFPRRNRLISGACLGVAVVEAALHSGSLITAHCALEQGREVFAVPGSPADPRAQGCNRLIKNGAILTESAEDIIITLKDMMNAVSFSEDKRRGFIPLSAGHQDEATLQQARRVIVNNLSTTPVLIDEVIRDCQFSAAVVQTIALELELAGRLQRHPGGQISLI